MQDKMIILFILFLGISIFLGMLISVKLYYANVKKKGMVILADGFLKFGIVFLFLLYLGYLICMVCDIQMYIENNMNLKELSNYGLVIAGLTAALNFLLSQDLIAVSDNRILLYFKREMDLTNIRIAKVKSVLGRKWLYIEGENCKRILITDSNSCNRILAMFEQRC